MAITHGARTRPRLRTLLAIAAGGALGAPARYEIAQLMHVPKDTFPWATFWTNMSGAFALALFFTVVIARVPTRRYLRALVATGFLGAYTTFSTMTVETVTLCKNGHSPLGITYLVSSLAGGLLVAALGIEFGRRLAPC